MQDFHLIDKLAHFDRERIPERVVHAKGAGAHGYFEVTADVSMYTKAKFLNKVGKRTPIFTRFSTVGGEKGSADAARDPRGFAVKFYTEEGNWDMVGNNTPIFFIRDPSKFPDFIHTQKRDPRTNLKNPDMTWDFFSLVPESVHQVTILYSSRGTPKTYRHMHGFSSHTLKLVNAAGEQFLVKWHFLSEAGIENNTAADAERLSGEDPDHATRDLHDHIEAGGEAGWRVHVQVMPIAHADTYRWDVYDITKVWPHADYPLIPVGRMVLNRNPENYFAEVEQAAFSPSHMVPGIEPSLDKMLQARLFSYPDTHRHRLGVNYKQIPINCPYAARVRTNQRDGMMAVHGNYGRLPNYEPNSFGGPEADPAAALSPYPVRGEVRRHKPAHPNCDFEQPGNLYRLMPEAEKAALVENIVGHLSQAKKFIQERQVKIFMKCDRDYGSRIAAGLLRTQSRL
jgi:catalase